ncbi:MAG: MgtC/SapB family protein [Planctomycetes bacterium]|nr:MgtC/SapB family protein [Planctomycetota bacterium]
MNEPSELLRAFLIAGCLGGLVGLERQVRHQSPEESPPVAGVRTFALLGLLGCLCAALSGMAPWLFIAGFLVISVQFMVSYVVVSKMTGDTGLTTETAGMLTFLTGGLVWWNQVQAAIALTIGVVVLLALKNYFKRLPERFTELDVHATLQFAVLSGIILPVVPDRPMGPFEAFNPREAWLMVVLVSGVGFAGYLAMRIWGASRGIVLTGLLGGFSSSTATTIAMSRRSREAPELSPALAVAVVLACTIMIPRLLLTVSVVNAPLSRHLWWPLALMMLPNLAFSFFLYRQSVSAPAPPLELRNPLGLRTAFKFALLYSVIVGVSKAALETMPPSAIYGISVLSGLTDVDAISLSVARLAGQGRMESRLALQAILIAIASNTFLKIVLASLLGSTPLSRRVAIALGITIFAAVALALWLPAS